MSRAFWFFAGAAASAFVVVKGRQYYRRLTPAGVAEQIEKLSEAFELRAGDIILSGTPENVGAVERW